MATISVGIRTFKKLFGTGIKSNLFMVDIPGMFNTVKNVVKSITKYKAKNSLEEDSGNSKWGTNIVSGLASLLSNGLLSMAKNVQTPDEGYDTITNIYWTKKHAGKVNLSPLSITFRIDYGYVIYDLFHYIKDAVLLNKEHGIYNYPENYMIKKISIATFNPAVYSQLNGYISYNIPINVRNYHNCFISNISGISKNKDGKDELEEFTVTFEYERSDNGETKDIIKKATAIAKYNVEKVTPKLADTPLQTFVNNR